MTTLLIDGNGLLWRAAHSLGEYQVAHGVLGYINEVLEKFSPESLIVCWDHGASRYRTEIYPEYKAQRKKHRDKFDMDTIWAQADTVREYLAAKGIQQVRVPGVEADDLISWISEYLSVHLQKEVVILSADKDLWQLVTDKVVVYDLLRGVKATPEYVEKTFGVKPLLIPQYKALVGDASDNIKGIKGLGDKRVKALFKEYGCHENMLAPDAVKKLSKSAVTARLYAFEDDYERDLLLTRLPKLADLQGGLKSNKLVTIPAQREEDCDTWYLTAEELASLSSQLLTVLEIDLPRTQVLANEIQRALIVYRAMKSVDFSGMPIGVQNQAVYSNWRELDGTIIGCNRCELRSHCVHFGPTLAAGYSDAQIMLVGRNPGQTELEAGEPFVGASGELIDEFLTACGLTRRDVYITNVCKCHSENNRALTTGEIGQCSAYLQAEVDLLKPKLIVTFGNEAMSLFTGFKSGVSRHSGEMVRHLETQIYHDALVAVSVHPSAALRSSQSRTNFDYAAKVVASYLEKRRG